jgi:hypothetical protein
MSSRLSSKMRTFCHMICGHIFDNVDYFLDTSVMTNRLLSEMWTFCHMIFSETLVMTTRLLKEQSHEIFLCYLLLKT